MRRRTRDQTERADGGGAPEAVIAVLADAGLRVERVERCPDRTCPLCRGGSRAAA